MILSSAANAGPYQNPMEKCMLNAFRRIYCKDKEPDPTIVYDEIEKAIASFGGIRGDQTLYFISDADGIILAMLWPWGDGSHITLKLVKK